MKEEDRCLCGYLYHRRRCKELIKKYPMLKDGDWHYRIDEKKQAQWRKK